MSPVDTDGLDGVIVRPQGGPPVVLSPPRFDLEGLDGVVPRTTISVPFLEAVELPATAPMPVHVPQPVQVPQPVPAQRPVAPRVQAAVLRSTSVRPIVRPPVQQRPEVRLEGARSGWAVAAGFAAAIAGGVASAIWVRSATGDEPVERTTELAAMALSKPVVSVVEPQAGSTSEAVLSALARCAGTLEIHVEVGADGQAALARGRALREGLLERGAAVERVSLTATAGRPAAPSRLLVQCRE